MVPYFEQPSLRVGPVTIPAFLLLGRRPRPPGFFLAAFVLLYAPVRLGLDVLRVSDVRYAGLTPAQWVTLGLVGAVLVAIARAYHRARRGPILDENGSHGCPGSGSMGDPSI